MEIQESIAQTFHINCEKIALPRIDYDHPDLGLIQNNMASDRLINSGYVPAETVAELLIQKSRLDVIVDKGGENKYYACRDKLYPLDRSGSKQWYSRAGEKLVECHLAIIPKTGNIINLIDCSRKGGLRFLDICGGPGAFSRSIFQLAKQAKIRTVGYGVTLKIGGDDTSLNWYDNLTRMRNFHILWGVKGNGNIYDVDNLRSITEYIGKNKLDLVVSDGGLGIHKIGDEYVESYKEFYTVKIILSELLLCLMNLRVGGTFVCKLVGGISHFTQSIIWLCCQLWKDVYLVKPMHSRAVNSESYLVCKKLEMRNIRLCTNLLLFHHARMTDDLSPISVVPLSWLLADKAFVDSTSMANTTLVIQQVDALKKVCDETEKLL